MITRGIIKATGAALKVELGFRPDFVRIHDLTTGSVLDWMAQYSTATLEGVVRLASVSGAAAAADITQSETTPFAVTAVDVSAAAVSLLAYGKGVSRYLPTGPATVFRRRAQLNALDQLSDPESLAWTLGSAANRTGNFSEGLPTGVGVGSKVVFEDGSEARIVALTNDGDAANEVTLDVAAPAARVVQIRYAETHAAAAVDNPREGFALAYAVGEAVAAFNTNGKRLLFEAGTYDL